MLQLLFKVEHISIYDHHGSYDCIYFSASFMLLPDPEKALLHVVSLLKNKKKGKIFFTQTIENKKNIFLESIKPYLKFFTTIDFGNVTYEKDFLLLLEKCHMKIMEHSNLTNSWRREAKLTVVQPK